MEHMKPKFQRIGGSMQYAAVNASSLPGILQLDPSLWTALAAPVSTLNCDQNFLNAIDFDRNGLIRVDDLCDTISFCIAQLKEITAMDDDAPELPMDALAPGAAADCLKEYPELTAGGKITLAAISAKIAALRGEPFAGTGKLSAAAVKGSGAKDLFQAVLSCLPGADGVTAGNVAQFLADGKLFLEWAAATPQPTFRDREPAELYGIFQSLETKLEEYFRFCELVALDEAHLKRFRLDPANLPALDLNDPAAVDAHLLSAPLAMPNAAGVLDFKAAMNPVFRAKAEAFAEAFGMETLSAAEWRKIKGDFQPYRDYLAQSGGTPIGAIGRDRLTALLDGDGNAILQTLFERDLRQNTILSAFTTLEKLLLCKVHLLRLINSFVSFRQLFLPGTSPVQAGRLIMDGNTYFLAIRIPSVAEHKKLAASSHLCTIYVELKDPSVPAPFYVAVAVTGGELSRIYAGKPAFFIGSTGKQFSGKVVDVVDGPISFRQTLLAPFRRLGAAIGGKVSQLTDFSSLEKQLNTTIATGKAPAPAPAKSMWSTGSVFLLAGGLSIAAIGAAFSFIAKTFVGIMATISRAPWWEIVIWIGAIILLFLIPASIHAMLKLRSRNLTRFLEGAGWTINLPMRLSGRVSRYFTRSAIYPDDAVFCRKEYPSVLPRGPQIPGCRSWILWTGLVLILLAAAAATLCAFFCCGKC